MKPSSSRKRRIAVTTLARVMKTSRVSSLAIRSSSRWRRRVSVSVRPVVLLRRRTQRLRQQRPVVDLDRQLAAAGLEDRAVDAEQVAEVERDEPRRAPPRRARPRRACSCMRPERSIEVEERRLALAAARVQAAGDAHARLGLLAGFESFVRRLGVARSASRPGRRAGTGRCPPPAAPRACGGGWRGARWTRSPPTPLRDFDLGDVSSRCLPLGSVHLDGVALLAADAAPCRPATRWRAGWPTGSASVEPTIVYVSDLPLSSLTWTCEPTRTTSADSSEASITDAERSLSSSVAMRDSSIACSFLASSYSEFSEMSPNSRASLMRSATSRRFVVERYSISCLSFSSPSGVRMTSFCMLRQSFCGAEEWKRPAGQADRRATPGSRRGGRAG